ncbi:TPA: hypothetical protein N0F65_013031 [Lagenidium giganteum]|uniref:glucan endo-1,3-beta-D-glucosidase n=1 Tax=Lagenidium giganteum TaxID=4803 RepID=A0AAV2YN00_9STRA|nr:TPA: hypothetical protein N0F65_013031 [Lagenidium giganteum]
MWNNSAFEYIQPNTNFSISKKGPGLMWRYGYNPEATLAEFSIPGDGRAWYDISIIPPGSDWCKSFDDCRQYTKRKGFNVGMSIIPNNTDGYTCRELHCPADRCADAYQYPTDDSKTHNCREATDFLVVFCPPDPAAVPAPVPTSTPAASAPSITAPTPTPVKDSNIKTAFGYYGAYAGNVAGSYNMTTQLKGCVRQRVTVNNPVGPLSEEVSMVFRGPMELYNIAVYDGSKDSTWRQVSVYYRGWPSKNLVFMNNKNIDYSGLGKYGPQCPSSSDGKLMSSRPTIFAGSLAEASDPTIIGGGPGVQTGVEVNIVTSVKCTATNPCKGYYDDQYSYHGWGGDKKIFVVKVQMPAGKKPNLPAIWMLNTQVLYAGQYGGCNCRGMGAVGGCGELDIAEVIETNPNRDRVSTHYYFYDGSIPQPPGGDNFAPRPLDKPTIFVTIISSANNGVVKILELQNFDFTTQTLNNDVVTGWINA